MNIRLIQKELAEFDEQFKYLKSLKDKDDWWKYKYKILDLC